MHTHTRFDSSLHQCKLISIGECFLDTSETSRTAWVDIAFPTESTNRPKNIVITGIQIPFPTADIEPRNMNR